MEWPEARARLDAPMFAPLQLVLSRLSTERWPTREELTALASDIRTASGHALSFVDPEAVDKRTPYEATIAATGQVPTRAENWHDLFNALAWITFPRAKAAINAQHAAILEERGDPEAKRRGPERDALTLFDEGGVIVACSDPALTRLIVDFEWKELFWRRRAELDARMRFFAFGHALYEKALEPYLGIVAKTIFVGFADDVEGADRLAAEFFLDRSRYPSPKSMAPMPVLGVPGWHPDSARESFYDDASHFRAKSAR